MLRQVVVIAFVAFALSVEGKVYKRCEVVKALRDAGVSEKQVPTFVCIAKYESSYDTKAVNKKTWDYGIFQISSKYWCQKGDSPGKGCNISCNSLLDDDIKNDIKCARKIYSQTKKEKGNGFSAWAAYNEKCSKEDVSKYVKNC